MVVKNIQFTVIEIKIIKYLFKHFKEKLNARQIARALKKNHSNVNKLCKLLVEKRLLKKEDLGNSIYYSFNYEKSSVNFVKLLLNFEDYPKILESLFYKMIPFKELVHFGLIFGSSIRKTKFNDIDVLLVYDKKKQQKINKIKTDIRKSKLIEKPIRYLELSLKDLNMNNEIIYSAMSNSILFCGTNQYSEVIENATNKE